MSHAAVVEAQIRIVPSTGQAGNINLQGFKNLVGFFIYEEEDFTCASTSSA